MSDDLWDKVKRDANRRNISLDEWVGLAYDALQASEPGDAEVGPYLRALLNSCLHPDMKQRRKGTQVSEWCEACGYENEFDDYDPHGP